jgi:hypothetical protein
MEERDLAVTLARGRIAFGIVSLRAPGLDAFSPAITCAQASSPAPSA